MSCNDKSKFYYFYRIEAFRNKDNQYVVLLSSYFFQKSVNDPFASSSGSGGKGSSKAGFANFSEGFSKNQSKAESSQRSAVMQERSPGKTSRLRAVLSKNSLRKHGDDQPRHSAKNVGNVQPAASSNNSGGFSEADQLQWAKLESQRSANLEESLRKQEEVDLELAISLSRIESLNSNDAWFSFYSPFFEVLPVRFHILLFCFFLIFHANMYVIF